MTKNRDTQPTPGLLNALKELGAALDYARDNYKPTGGTVMTNRKVVTGTTYHMQMTLGYVEVLLAERGEEHGFTIGGKPATAAEVRAALERMHEAGMVVLPCCDNTNERGECLGVLEAQP